MSKIICDICGTAYPDTADQCPICGSAKQIDSEIISDTMTEGVDRSVKTATKGGHFSNANVRKRNKGKKLSVAAKKTAAPAKPAKPLFSPQGTQKPVGRWACPDCGNVLPGDVIQCKCGYRRTKENNTTPTATNMTGKWACPDCGNSHPGDVKQCECGYKR